VEEEGVGDGGSGSRRIAPSTESRRSSRSRVPKSDCVMIVAQALDAGYPVAFKVSSLISETIPVNRYSDLCFANSNHRLSSLAKFS